MSNKGVESISKLILWGKHTLIPKPDKDIMRRKIYRWISVEKNGERAKEAIPRMSLMSLLVHGKEGLFMPVVLA